MRRKWSLRTVRAVSVLLWAAFLLDAVLFLWMGAPEGRGAPVLLAVAAALLAANLILWLAGWRCPNCGRLLWMASPIRTFFYDCRCQHCLEELDLKQWFEA